MELNMVEERKRYKFNYKYLFISKNLFFLFLIICFILYSENSYSQSWEDAYEIWLETYEVAIEVLELAELAEFLGNLEVAENQRNVTLGHLEERTLNFIREDVPFDKCNDYAKALINIGTVIGELLPGETANIVRTRVVEIFNDCPSDSDFTIHMLPFGSQWNIKLEYREDHGIYHINYLIEGVFSIPNLPPLVEILGTKEDWDEMENTVGWISTYAWSRAHLIWTVQFMGVDTTISGIYQESMDPNTVHSEGDRYFRSVTWTGCPEVNISIEYNLEIERFDSDLTGFFIIHQPHSYEEIADITFTTVETTTDKRDGSTHVEEYRSECYYIPSSSFAYSRISIENGTYIVEQYEDSNHSYETKITLNCIDSCQ